jgi:hypothetical protein
LPKVPSELFLDNPTIAPDMAAELFVQWVQHLSTQKLGVTQWATSGVPTTQYRFSHETGDAFVIESPGDPQRWRVASVKGFSEDDVRDVINEAVEHVRRGEFGEDVVYESVLTFGGAFQDLSNSTHVARTLGDQRRVTGERRLGSRVILSFTEEAVASEPTPIAPGGRVTATVFAPGPAAGPLSTRVGSGLVEIAAAVCALALGRPVEYTPVFFSAEDEQTTEARRRRADPSILGLARDSVSLDVFDDLASRGGMDAMLRARGAFLAYHAAFQQRNADVATMLFVTAIEALISPRPEWRKQKVTKRFINALLELCPVVVDEILAHPSVEEALSYRRRGAPARQRRDVLSQIYDLRSQPTHSGIGLSVGRALVALAEPHQMRVALLSDLARGAILSFLQAPRSFIIGHLRDSCSGNAG